MRRQAAFTLVELVMVIALAGVVAVMISTVLVRPMQGLVDQSRRAGDPHCGDIGQGVAAQGLHQASGRGRRVHRPGHSERGPQARRADA